jgi:hypothetical protein
LDDAAEAELSDGGSEGGSAAAAGLLLRLGRSGSDGPAGNDGPEASGAGGAHGDMNAPLDEVWELICCASVGQFLGFGCIVALWSVLLLV